ncbi:chloroperoxidase-like protein [Paraphaeosphaeria sporulosa]
MPWPTTTSCNLTVSMLVSAFDASMNISSDFTTFVATAVLPLAPDGGVSSVHGVSGAMEHDGSLSREDHGIAGDATTFLPRVFREFLSYFGSSEEFTLPLAAEPHWERILFSRRTCPSFAYTEGDRLNSYIQSAIYQQSMKEPASGTVPVRCLKVWFQQERLSCRRRRRRGLRRAEAWRDDAQRWRICGTAAAIRPHVRVIQC